MSKIINVGRVTAYADAVKGGYQGTREEWENDLANLGTTAAEVEADRQEVAANTAAVATDKGIVEGYKNAANLSAQASAASAGAAHTDALAATAAKEAAETAQGLAESAKDSAVAAKGGAETAQGAAEAAVTQASGYADNASGSATAAAGSATAAAGSATDAAASATAAAGSADEAEAVLESIPEDYSTLSNDVTDLKSALNRLDCSSLLKNGYRGTPDIGNVYGNFIANDGYRTCLLDVMPGDILECKGAATNAVRVWAFADADKKITRRADYETIGVPVTLTTASNERYFIYNDDIYNPPALLYITINRAATLEDIRSRITTLEADLSGITSRVGTLETDVDNIEASLAEQGNFTPVIDSLAIKTQNVFDSFTINSGTYNFDSTANISNYQNYAAASAGAKNTPPVRIRNISGELIYKNLRLNLAKTSKPTVCVWLFGKDGYYLRKVNFDEFYVVRTAPYFLNDEYYAIFNLYPAASGYEDYAWIVDNVNIEWFNQKPEYHVGADKEYTTINAMLTALADDPREKIVYIDPGEYDMFEEYGGADYMASLAATASTLNWRDVCKVVPPNTHIIGLGDVTLKWIASAADMVSADVAVLFSPLNISGNCTIENIKVIGQNCRYAVHDEMSGIAKYDGSVHHYINCHFECLQSTYNATTPYGSGHNKNSTLIFDNCEFVNYQNNAWATHHQAANATEASTIVFNDCIFRCTRVNSDFAVQFTTDKTNGLKDKVRFDNCYIAAKIKFYTASATEVGQGYDVTLVGSSSVTVVYSANVTTRYDVRQLNPIVSA